MPKLGIPLLIGTLLRMTDLTEREREVLTARVGGETFKSIALRMGIAEGTTHSHHARAVRKLGCRTFRGGVRRWNRELVTMIEWVTKPVTT